MTLPRAAYLAAHRAGIKVMLDGVAGDVVLGAGNLVPRLLRRGDWRRAWREIKGERHFWGPYEALPRQVLRYLRSALTPNLARQVRHQLRQLRDRLRPVQSKLVNQALARRVNLTARHAGFRNLFHVGWRDPAVERVDGMTHIYLTVGRERYDRVSAALAIEPRDPFMDLRVINFCLSLPARQLQFDGWPKIILRRAMAGLLPDSVRWRTGKEHLGWTFTSTLLQARAESFRHLTQNPTLLSPLVSAKGLQERASGLVENEACVNLYHLELWLRSQTVCPAHQ